METISTICDVVPLSRRCPHACRRNVFAWAALLVLGVTASLHAYDSQSNGLDGALSLNSSQEIDLSLAWTGPWNATERPQGDGVYDPALWAVVFHFTTIDIQAGATVTLKNHAKGAPVVWLASGDVNIHGTVNLSGKPGLETNTYASGGPGGFAGGIRLSSPLSASAGFGPGGGSAGNCVGAGGGFAAIGAGTGGGVVYGSPTLLPLIGGSGGGGSNCTVGGGGGGGGGGGAILIASSGIVQINGAILAHGGAPGTNAGPGSGGAIRLVADEIGGTGQLRARSGLQGEPSGLGRIRVETLPDSMFLQTIDPAPSWDIPGPLFLLPEDGAPQVRIVSIQGVPSPVDPFGSIVWSEDVLISAVGTLASVNIEARNIDPLMVASVDVRLVRDHGSAATPAVAPVLQGNFGLSNATATLNIPPGRSVIQVRVRMLE